MAMEIDDGSLSSFSMDSNESPLDLLNSAEISARPTGQKVIKKHLDDWIKEKESLASKESPAKKFKTLQKKGIPSLHFEEVKSHDPNFKMPEEPKRKQAKKNVTFDDKNTENNASNVKSFKQKKHTSPQKDPIRTNNTNVANEEKPADQEKGDINTASAKSPQSKSPKSENKEEHVICPPGFINVLQSRMVFDWFKELMRCREDSIGVGMLLECHSTNFQKSLYFKTKCEAFGGDYSKLLIGIGFLSSKSTKPYFLPFPRVESEDVSKRDVEDFLVEFFSSHVPKLCYNVKECLKILYQCGLDFHPKDLLDPMIAAWLYNPDMESFEFEHVLRVFFATQESSKENIEKFLHQRNPTPTTIGKVFLEDLIINFKLMSRLTAHMNQLECYQVFKDQEMRVAPLLARIETTGILFNREALSNHKAEINARIEKIKTAARDSVGYDVPLSSPKKLAEILFQKLQLAPEENPNDTKKSKKNHESTAETVLMQLKDKHALPGLILEYRHWAKLLSTFVESLEKKAIFDEHDKTFKIKAHWDQLTATGRLASSEPNLQNLPKEDYAIMDGDKPARIINVRSAFISREGYTLLSVDYSQIEMRILAHLCGDPALTKMIIAGEDIHKAVASIWLAKSPKHVTDGEREQAKEIGYGIIYGMGASGLGQKLKITTQQAQKLIHDFLQRFSAVQNFVRQSVNNCKKNGSVKTLTNRRRLFDKINDRSNSTLASKQERQCVNTVIQGTAADLAKRTMIDMDDIISADKLDARLLVQLHDELVYEVKSDQVDVLVNAIKKVVAKSGGLKMNVPTPVNISVGQSFGALEAYNK
eukprot:TRINITY_DN11366_c0_g1_i1.p1 TRINITY_DN11366_c0_g1~~TRINITY_DN11366_c0_g1_i1.p1  ORF type:complete len:818 (+),score=162.61 TRINITY_DN11366_c0_g1_i1:70-2523(+)